MITNITREAINKYVDEYIDEMRLDIFYLKHERNINEIESGKFTVIDSDVIIDWSMGFNKILQHPIEDFFIPEKAELFVVEYALELQQPDLVNLVNFDVEGISHQEEIHINDHIFDDETLICLINHTCFDERYQKRFPEVTDYLNEVYQNKHPLPTQVFLDRIRPLLNL